MMKRKRKRIEQESLDEGEGRSHEREVNPSGNTQSRLTIQGSASHPPELQSSQVQGNDVLQ